MGRYTPAVEALYCEKCGKRLVDVFIFYKYELETGDRLFVIKSACKDKKWTNKHSSLIRNHAFAGKIMKKIYRIEEK